MTDVPSVLRRIAAYKRDEVAALRPRAADLLVQATDQPAPRGFAFALSPAPALIAEIKKASPSKGTIREDFDPAALARAYTAGGASALSCLTDGPGFGGSRQAFESARAATFLPLLRKDFYIDPLQVLEARAMGADAVLVILAMLTDTQARAIMDAARTHGMDALVETHTARELDRALALDATLIGVNNRDLHSFDTTLDVFDALSPRLPTHVVRVAESGIFTRADVERVTLAGADAILVGESLMRQTDVEAATRRLLALDPKSEQP